MPPNDSSHRPRLEVLVVEPSDEVRDALVPALAAHGLNVWLVRTGPHAVEVYRRQLSGLGQSGARIDVAVLDASLPGDEAAETLLALRELSPSLPVIFMAVAEGDYPVAEWMRLGATEFVGRALDRVADLAESLCRSCGR